MTKNSGPRQPMAQDAARLRQVIDAYGADPARWPAAERTTLRALAETPGGVLSANLNAAQLDTLLDGLPDVLVPTALTNSVLRAAPGPVATKLEKETTLGQRLAGLWTWMPVWRPAAALAFVALFVLALGSITTPPVNSPAIQPEKATHIASGPAGIDGLSLIDDPREAENAWQVAFYPADIGELLTASDAEDIEDAWEVVFEPAGIVMAGYVVNDR